MTWATAYHAETDDFKQRTNKISIFFSLKENIYHSLLIVLEGPDKERNELPRHISSFSEIVIWIPLIKHGQIRILQ